MTAVAGYRHELGGHCGSGAYRDLLEWAGLDVGTGPLSEAMVFGLAGDLAMRFVRYDLPGAPPFHLAGRGYDLETVLPRRLGLDVEVLTTDDPEVGRERLHAELDAGFPVLCWADIGELPYLRTSMPMSRHDIVVTGFDPAAGTYTVVDNDRADPQPVDAAALGRARASTGFPVPTRHTQFRLRYPDALPPVAALVGSAVRDSAAASSPGDVAAFVDEVSRWTTDDVDPEARHRRLVLLWAYVEKAGTGGGFFRRLQADFLAELTGLLPDDGSRDAAAVAARHYAGLAERWSAIAAAARADGDPAARAGAVADLAADLPGTERAGAEALVALADSIRVVRP